MAITQITAYDPVMDISVVEVDRYYDFLHCQTFTR